MKFQNFYISKKKDINFDHMNKSLFESLRDEEHFRLNKLNEQFAKILTDFTFKNGGIRAETKGVSLETLMDNVTQSAKNNKKIMNKITELKTKHRNIKEISINEELVKSDEELIESGFFIKFPDLK